jgi:transcriptional regulator GlxA family with amidase domain
LGRLNERKFFKRHTGTTFISYLNKVRIEAAARMLLETDLPCNFVAYDCGFNSLSRFYKLFGKYYRKAPKEFKSRMRSNLAPVGRSVHASSG